MAYDAKTREHVLQLYRDGVDYHDIYVATGVKRRAARAWAAAAGLPGRRPPGPPSSFTAEDKALAVELYAEGVRLVEIQARIGASQLAIKQWVDKAMVKRRPSGSTPRCSREELVRLHEKLGTHAAVAEGCGLNRSTVSYHLARGSTG